MALIFDRAFPFERDALWVEPLPTIQALLAIVFSGQWQSPDVLSQSDGALTTKHQEAVVFAKPGDVAVLVQNTDVDLASYTVRRILTRV